MNIHFLFLAVIAISINGCKKVPAADADDQAFVAQALAVFASELEESLPADIAVLKVRIGNYMGSNPSVFYGATVALLDTDGVAVYSPYVYRPNGVDLVFSDSLMDPTYQINSQSWLRAPIDQATSVWTEPYFDEGGGDIWMKTRSVPIYQNGKIVAVATTDVRVKKP
jgi:sigma-B regulation protein RsbU (phosphoserine phosphatase)